MPDGFSAKYKPKTRALSEDEIRALLDELPPHRAAVVAFIVATSATYPSEVRDVTRSDVDVKAWMVHLRGTKREMRDRRVPVPSFARPWLSFALQRARKTGRLFAPWPSVRRDLRAACARLSLCEACRERVRHRGPGKTAIEKCKACERTPEFLPCSPNDLRRSLATLLRARGVEPQLIAPILGHADSRMVERVYGRVPPEQLAHLLEQRLERYAGASRGPARRRIA
jgi:integrase